MYSLSHIHLDFLAHFFGQTSVKLEYRIKANDPFEDIGKASISIQKGITLHDIFGRSTDIDVDTVRSMSLDRASLPATFESIRLAMIRALVAQMSKVQALRTDNTSRDAHPPEEVMAIVDNIKAVVGCIDGLVSDASPHLVFSRLGHAFTILKVLWPKDFEIGSDFHASMPGAYGDEESDTSLPHDIPAACPRALRRLIADMVLSQNAPDITRAQLSVKGWEAAKRPTLTKQFKKVPTFAGALETFSHDLYHRSTDPARRTEQAVSQFQDVMGVIQFCHLVIITQLDAPYEWYCKSTEGHQITSAALGALPSYFSGASLFSRVLASSFMESLGVGAISAAGLGVTGGIAVLFASTAVINHLLNKHKEYLDLSFPGALAVTLQALSLPVAESDDIVEKTLLDRVKQDIASSHTQETIEKWRVKLEEGLKDYPGVKANQWCITPTFFWPKWLFSVAQVAQLRIQLSDKICIGVQGSTEAGKSQMLTVLTGASEDYFKPGSSSLCRTLGIQSYDSKIKYMADVFQELFAIVIIVIPMERTRSEATESALRIAIKLLRNQEDKRPLRILLSQADDLDHHRNNKQKFRDTLRDVKEQFMARFRQELGENFTTFRQQPFRDGIVCKSEKLEDIVKPFSTHAQMTLDGIGALADYPPKTPCKIERESHFENLCELADAGEMWDIESLRSWLRDLSPSSVPMSSGRVRVYCD
ncbi:Cytochrome P450 4X1 [Fusarium oxysporum f. sp. albedinis]|nr:Cytochrome P450 4X1 [Fusarium oxysporum f. sp. albedinis]